MGPRFLAYDLGSCFVEVLCYVGERSYRQASDPRAISSHLSDPCPLQLWPTHPHPDGTGTPAPPHPPPRAEEGQADTGHHTPRGAVSGLPPAAPYTLRSTGSWGHRGCSLAIICPSGDQSEQSGTECHPPLGLMAVSLYA